MSQVKTLDIVLGLLANAAGEVYISRRQRGAHLEGKWEFPGGKVDAGESLETALHRELDEELGIDVEESCLLGCIEHHYAELSVRLHLFRIDAYRGEPYGREGQMLRHVSKSSLSEVDFPEANKDFIKLLTLAECYLISEDDSDPKRCLAKLKGALEHGHKLIQLRLPSMSAQDYAALLPQALGLASTHKAQLLAKGEPSLLARYQNLGLHLSSAQLSLYQAADFEREPQQLLAASCHNLAELEQAKRLGVDFVTLSALKPTRSHPELAPLGWLAAERLLDSCWLPCYGLGGMTRVDVADAQNKQMIGIAAISALWEEIAD